MPHRKHGDFCRLNVWKVTNSKAGFALVASLLSDIYLQNLKHPQVTYAKWRQCF